MTSSFIDGDGRVTYSPTAEEMAYIEKPFREEKIGMIKSLFTSRASEVLKGQEKSEEYLNELLEHEKKLKEKLRVEEEERKEFELRNPQELQKLDTYIKYLKTNPNFLEAINFLYDFADKANLERSDDSYKIYKKARRALYENFYKSIDVTDNMYEVLMIPTDWRTTEDDEWFLKKLIEKGKKSSSKFYRNGGYINIYAAGIDLSWFLKTGIINKSLASAMIMSYSDYTGCNLKEFGTRVFVEETLRSGTKGGPINEVLINKYPNLYAKKGLLDCVPTSKLKASDHFMKYFGEEIYSLEQKQQIQYNMNKEEYRNFLEKKGQEALQEITKQEKRKKETEEKREQRKNKEEQEIQEKIEQERLQAIERDKLRQDLLKA